MKFTLSVENILHTARALAALQVLSAGDAAEDTPASHPLQPLLDSYRDSLHLTLLVDAEVDIITALRPFVTDAIIPRGSDFDTVEITIAVPRNFSSGEAAILLHTLEQAMANLMLSRFMAATPDFPDPFAPLADHYITSCCKMISPPPRTAYIVPGIY
ncbi:MAG: hypothetical protein NC098_06685 [Lachnoclostridium sp.]|nr:hypothetical protein [Lachnoclostridium sp.]